LAQPSRDFPEPFAAPGRISHLIMRGTIGAGLQARDLRQNSDGSFRIVYVHEFSSLDVRDARTAADVWLADMMSSLQTASHVRLLTGSTAVCARPLNRRVWEMLG
jgi:hypothetical protein